MKHTFDVTRMHRRKNKVGFTLVELIIVIAVIGVLAAILIPTFANVIDKANAKSALSDARNVISKYAVDRAENPGLPSSIVITVKKAGKYHLFGFDADNIGKVQISDANPIKVDTLSDVIAKYSWNEKTENAANSGDAPVITETYDPAVNGYFYLVPATRSIRLKAFRAAEDLSAIKTKYTVLNDSMANPVEEGTVLFHGVLLPGTFDGDPLTSTDIGGTVTPKAEINFLPGGSGIAEFDSAAVVFMNGSTELTDAKLKVNVGSTFIPATVRAIYGPDSNGKIFIWTGWDPADSFTPATETDTITYTAQWESTPLSTYAVTFDAGEGNALNIGTVPASMSGWTNGQKVTEGTDIAQLIKTTTASHFEPDVAFLGWKSSISGTTVPDDVATYVVSEPVTFTALYSNTKYDATFKPGEGATGSEFTIQGKTSDTIAFPKADDARVSAWSKDGYILKGWKHSSGTEYYVDGASVANIPFDTAVNMEFTAIWVKNTFTVRYDKGNVTAGDEGNVTLPGGGTKEYAVGTASVTLEVSTYPGYFGKYNVSTGVSDLAMGSSLDTSAAKPGDVYVVTCAWYPQTIKVTYESGTVDAGVLPADWVTITSWVLKDHGNSNVVTLHTPATTITKDAEWNFDGWKDSEGTKLTSGTLEVALTNDEFINVTVTATWKTARRNVTVTLQDSFNGDTVTTITVKNYKGNSMKLADVIAADTENNRGYWVAANASDVTITASNTATINGTRLAKPSGKSYAPYKTGAEAAAYSASDANCYQVITTKTGFLKMNSTTGLTYRYMQAANLTLGTNDPIGWLTDDTYFTGVYDGCGKSISYSLTSGGSNKGLWALNAGTIKNVVAKYSGTMNGTSNVGGFVGSNKGTIQGCTHTGVISSTGGSYNNVGGFVGTNENGGVITDCHHTSGAVTSGSKVQYTGGFVGANYGTIEWCSNSSGAKVTSSNVIVGGFAGANASAGIIRYSYCETAAVSGTTEVSNTCVGGFAGRLYGVTENCYARTSAIITGSRYVAGFGTLMNSSAKAINCYNKPSGSLSYNTNYNNVAFDYYKYDAGATISNCYVVTSSSNTSYVKSTKAASDSALKTAVSGNSSWTSAGCWDWSGSYVKLKSWAEVYGTSEVKFVSNLAGVANPEAVSGAYGTEFTMPTLTPPSGSYTFLGWAESSTATSAKFTGGQKTTFAGDKTYYGVWNCTDTFSITFVAGQAGATGVPANITDIAYNSNKTLPSTMPTLSGSELVCVAWVDQDSVEYAPGATISGIKKNYTLTGKWLDTIHITSQADLEKVAEAPNASYIVDNDFTCTNYDAICGTANSFTGVFNGNGKTITYSGEQAHEYFGLFGSNKGRIYNLNVVATSSNWTNSSSSGGCIAGVNEVGGTISGCNVTVSDFRGMHTIGGVAGRNQGTISDCHITITTLKSYGVGQYDGNSQLQGSMMGGIVGYNYATGVIELCSVEGKLQGYGNSQTSNSGGYVGGIAGWNRGGSIDQCWFKGSLNENLNSGYGGNCIGGIAGRSMGNTASITNCWAYCDYLNGYDYEAGIAGLAQGTIRNCWANSVDGGTYNGNYLGAITPSASTGTIENVYYESSDMFAAFGVPGKGTATTFGGTTPLAGFSTSIWEFVDGNYPGLINNPV